MDSQRQPSGRFHRIFSAIVDWVREKPAETTAPGRGSDWHYFIPVFALIWLSSLGFDFPTLVPELDPSWMGVLADSVVEDRRFGTEIVYTYGPLGHYEAYQFHPKTFSKKIWWEVISRGAMVFVLFQACRQFERRWAWIFILFTFFLLSVGPGSFSWMAAMFTAVLCVLHIESGSRWKPFFYLLLLISLALAKFTLFIAVAFSIAIIAVIYFLRARWLEAAIFLFTSFALTVWFWKFLGQSSRQLPAYLQNSLSVSSGFAKTMGVESPLSWTILGLICVGTSLACAILSFPMRRQFSVDSLRSLVKLGLPLGFLFLSWKHGFIRADAHILIFFVFVPFFLAALLLLRPANQIVGKAWKISATVAMISVFLALPLVYSGAGLTGALTAFLPSASRNLDVLVAPEKHRIERLKKLRATERAHSLPRIKESASDSKIDVFSDLPAYAVLNRLNYHPRPVFQSFSAYTPRLINLNESFYQSDKRPELVMLSLGEIGGHSVDGRFPTLADSKALGSLLYSYRPRFRENQFLLLESTSLKAPEWTANSIEIIRTQLGKSVDLSGLPDTPIWAEIDVSPSMLGRARRFFYRAAELRLSVETDQQPGITWEYRFFPAFGNSGFLISPLIRSTHDVIRHYRCDPMSRPVKMTISPTENGEPFFQKDIKIRLFQLPPTPTELRWKSEDSETAVWRDLGVVPERHSAAGMPLVEIVGGEFLSLSPAPGEIELAIPSRAKTAHGYFGMSRVSFVGDSRSDGALFRIVLRRSTGGKIEDQLLWEKYLNPNRHRADRELQRFSISIPPESKEARLILTTNPGPAGDSTGDSTGWGQIRFE